mgnify:CR=1 FL=1
MYLYLGLLYNRGGLKHLAMRVFCVLQLRIGNPKPSSNRLKNLKPKPNQTEPPNRLIQFRLEPSRCRFLLISDIIWLRGDCDLVVNKLLHQARQYQVRLDAMAMVWDADQGSSLSQSLHSGVVGWIDTLISLSPFYLFIYILSLSNAYISSCL